MGIIAKMEQMYFVLFDCCVNNVFVAFSLIQTHPHIPLHLLYDPHPGLNSLNFGPKFRLEIFDFDESRILVALTQLGKSVAIRDGLQFMLREGDMMGMCLENNAG